MKKYHFTKVLILVSAIAMTSFSAAKISDDSYTLKYNLKKSQTVEYVFTAETETTQEIQGTENTSNSTSSAKMKMTSNGRTKDGKLSLILEYESFSIRMYNAMFDTTFTNPEGLIGKRIQKILADNGDQIKSVELDTIKLPTILGQGFTSQQEILQNLPQTPIKAGETITNTDVDSVSRFGGTVVMKSTSKYTLLGTEEKNNHQCVKVKVATSIEVKGDGAIQGMKFFIEGDGDIDGTFWFAPEEGLLVSSQSQMDMESTAAITGQMNMTIPITQAVKTTIDLVE